MIAVGGRGAGRAGGEGGIRTLDGLPHTAFPVPRPRPLGDLSGGAADGMVVDRDGGGRWRRGWDSNPRCFRTPLFESGTFNHSDTSPRASLPKGARGPLAPAVRRAPGRQGSGRSSAASSRRMPETTPRRRGSPRASASWTADWQAPSTGSASA